MRITPYLSFNGNCRDALTFYAELFSGTVESFVTWNAEAIENIPGATVEHIMHGSININGYTIAGSDQFGDMYQAGGNISMMMDMNDLSEAEAKFTALAEDGNIMMPFGETFWADGYGFCTDRFGIMWQINCTGSKTM